MSEGSKTVTSAQLIKPEESVLIIESMTNIASEDHGWCKVTRGLVSGELVTIVDTPMGCLRV